MEKSDSLPIPALGFAECQPTSALATLSVNWSQLIFATSLKGLRHSHILQIRKLKLRKSKNLPKDDRAAKSFKFPSLGLSLGKSYQNTQQLKPSAFMISSDYSSLKPWETEQKITTFQAKNLRFRELTWFVQVLHWLASGEAPLNTRSFIFTWIVDLQCCVSFRCIAKWFSYTYIYFFPYRLLQNIEFPVLYNRSLLVICFIDSSVYMLIPNP